MRCSPVDCSDSDGGLLAYLPLPARPSCRSSLVDHLPFDCLEVFLHGVSAFDGLPLPEPAMGWLVSTAAPSSAELRNRQCDFFPPPLAAILDWHRASGCRQTLTIGWLWWCYGTILKSIGGPRLRPRWLDADNAVVPYDAHHPVWNGRSPNIGKAIEWKQ